MLRVLTAIYRNIKVTYYERAARMDPLSATIGFSLGWMYMAQQRFDLAILQLEKARDLDPSLVDARVQLARARLFNGQHRSALLELEEAAKLAERRAMVLAFLGHGYAVAARRSDAQRIFDELLVRSRETYVSPLAFAIICIGLGDKDQAFEWLDKARAAADPWLTENGFDLIFDPLRSDPRWQQLRRAMGFSGLPD